MIVLILCLFLAIVTLQFVVRGLKNSFGFVSEIRNKLRPATAASQSSSKTEAVVVAQELDPVFSMPEVTATPLVVKQLDQGRATLILRYRARKQACTAHLIVWSGAKRRRIQDSYYDLGVIAGDQVDEKVIDQFLSLAKDKLVELQTAGRKKRQQKAETVVLPTELAVEQPAAVPDTNSVLDGSVKLKKFPSVLRGIILEAGMMKASRNGATFETFGVKFKTPDGVEDVVFGRNLRLALKEAMAGVGDHVEILKIGRKTVEKGKAPMNLFQVTKLAASATVQ